MMMMMMMETLKEKMVEEEDHQEEEEEDHLEDLADTLQDPHHLEEPSGAQGGVDPLARPPRPFAMASYHFDPKLKLDDIPTWDGIQILS